jgi:exopolyphosphatase/pppGpp-phosphohydrolase
MTAWGLYECASCGSPALAKGPSWGKHKELELVSGLGNGSLEILEVFPAETVVDEALPARAKLYLQQALETLHAPDAAVMVAASAVDAMLKEIGLREGSLYSRIERAKSENRITDDMARWAHQVRLDANDPRHADIDSPHHDEASARRAVDFAKALGDFLFVLPQRITRGLSAAKSVS